MTHDISDNFMKKMQIYIEEDTLEELKYLALKQKTSYSMIVRKSIKDYLRKKSNKKNFSWAKHSSKFSGNLGGDISKNVDEILYK